MPRYTLPENPEVILEIPGTRDTVKSREKAMDQLVELMDEEKLGADLPNGFSPDRFVIVSEELPDLAQAENNNQDEITKAVQILSTLASLKAKLQETRTEALAVRSQIDILFSDAPASAEQLSELKNGFRILKTFAGLNERYRAARAQAEAARQILDKALQADSI